MKVILVVISIFLLLHLVTAPPPRRIEKNDKKHEKEHEKNEIDDFGLEYNRYLREVIDLLESDVEFKKKLDVAHEVDIRSGQIAKELEYVDHKVRSQLDEVKRQEIERLRHLAQKQVELSNGIDTDHIKVSSEHLDHKNPHTFEMEDLKKLIAKVSEDLNKVDEKRRKEFKEYEMQKEFEKQQKLQHLQGSEREAFEKQLKENETKHKQHEPLHEPGSKQQLEEVWEKQDHMENQEFDPKVFFQLHDLDGNGHWDHNEVKALFLKELDKMYEAGAPEDDMKERVEEMERMREHVFNEADKNKDGLISFDEFIEKTKQPEFEKDPGWETIDQKPVYTHEEYLEFERRRQQEVQNMIKQGLIPPQPVFQHDPYQMQGQYVQYHPQQVPSYQGGHPQEQARYAANYPVPHPPAQPVPPNQPVHPHMPANYHYQQPSNEQQKVHQQPLHSSSNDVNSNQQQQGFHQPPQQQQSQSQGQNQHFQQPQNQHFQQPHAQPSLSNSHQVSGNKVQGYDVNEIQVEQRQQLNLKYSNDDNNNAHHPNAVESQNTKYSSNDRSNHLNSANIPQKGEEQNAKSSK